MAGLAELVDRYPREHYSLMQVGAPGERRTWREGEIGKMSGDRVIEAIANGRMRLNLRNVSGVDKGSLRCAINCSVKSLSACRAFPPSRARWAFSSRRRRPRSTITWTCRGSRSRQIHGKKRVYVYPAELPFRRDEDLERIALFQAEVDIPYDTPYDSHARVFEIEGGEMLHWPLNAPHRVENLDCLNVSMTTEYWTDTIRRSQMINLANGILRHKLGVTPRSRATSGAGFWAKAALQAGVKRAGLLQKACKERRSIEFQLDTERIGAIRDLALLGGKRDFASQEFLRRKYPLA